MFEIIKFVYGEEEVKKVEEVVNVLFSGGVDMLNVLIVIISKEEIGLFILDIMVSIKIVLFKKEGRRLIE